MTNDIDGIIWNEIKRGKHMKDICYNNKYSVSYDEFTERKNQIKSYRKFLRDLNRLERVEQRTPEWYNMRLNMLTASNTLNAVKCHKSLIKQKATQEFKHFSSEATLWGTKFEPIAQEIYSTHMNNMKIYEFGLIKSTDPDIDFYGASPDGITATGIMLEIKCPYTRKIKPNYILPEYYAQMQGQMAVCKLSECDFAQFEFDKITLEEFLELKPNKKDCFCGIIKTIDGKYEYSNQFEDPLTSFNSMKDGADSDSELLFWKLNKFDIQRVKFDKNEWDTYYKPGIIKFWDNVKEYQKSMFNNLYED